MIYLSYAGVEVDIVTFDRQLLSKLARVVLDKIFPGRLRLGAHFHNCYNLQTLVLKYIRTVPSPTTYSHLCAA